VASDGLLRICAWGAACLLAALLMGPTGHVAAEEVPSDRQALILTRALAYDVKLKERAGPSVIVAVLFRRGHPASEAMAAMILPSFAALSVARLRGLPFAAVGLPYVDPKRLEASIQTGGVDALYVCVGLDGADFEAIKAVSRARKVITMASQQEQVQRGATLGVFRAEGRALIAVNLAAAAAEGAAFESAFLKLAKVFR
jgi:hypothetical protein